MWNKFVGFFKKMLDSLFYIDMSEYDNLGSSTNKIFNITLVITAIFIGMAIASITIFFQKSVLGSFVRKLIQLGADSEEKAVKAEKINEKYSKFFVYAVKHFSLSKVVCKTTDEDGCERYYIQKEKSEEINRRYSDKGSNIYYLIIALVVFTALAVLTVVFRAEIAYGINVVLGWFFKD